MSAGQPEAPRRRLWGIQLRILLGFFVIAMAIGLLVAHGAKKSMVYYISVTELLAQDRDHELNGLRVSGTVVPGTIERQDLLLRFQVTDGNKAVPVEYRGVVPDTFGDKGEVVVEGSFHPGGVFEANFLMAKCPSKYEMSPDEEPPEGMPRPRSKTS